MLALLVVEEVIEDVDVRCLIVHQHMHVVLLAECCDVSRHQELPFVQYVRSEMVIKDESTLKRAGPCDRNECASFIMTFNNVAQIVHDSQ